MIGDGAMQMNGVNELITVSRYWQDWPDPRFVVLVLNNRQLAFVSWETRGTLGVPPDPAQASLPDVPYARWAQLLGLDGARIETADQVDDVLDLAFSSRRPFVIDAVVDADVPLIPPHLTRDQVLKTARAEFAGDPAFFGIVADGLRETVGATLRARVRGGRSSRS
jgi:pyruvate dehydrogenase (quinone)